MSCAKYQFALEVKPLFSEEFELLELLIVKRSASKESECLPVTEKVSVCLYDEHFFEIQMNEVNLDFMVNEVKAS